MRGVRASEDCNKSFATRSFTAVKFLKARGRGSSWETARVPCSPRPTHVPPAQSPGGTQHQQVYGVQSFPDHSTSSHGEGDNNPSVLTTPGPVTPPY